MESSGTSSCATIRKLSFSRTCATAGPDKSLRSPRAQESLTGLPACRVAPGPAAARDRTFAAAFTGRFVEQAQTFHQQALGIQLRGFFVGLALKVEFETAARPAQNFEHRLVAHQRAIGRVLNLAFDKKHL